MFLNWPNIRDLIDNVKHVFGGRIRLKTSKPNYTQDIQIITHGN